MIEADIFPLIKHLASGQVYPYIAPPGTIAPWVIFSLPASTADDVLMGQSGASATSLQIDIYAPTIDDARNLLEQVKTLIKDLMPVALMSSNGYESDTALYRSTIEVQVWK